MKRILICGDRDWTDAKAIREALVRHHEQGDIVMHGACRGADKMADALARMYGWVVEPYPAEWEDENGKLRLWAGPERNKKMLKLLNPETDVVLAFHPDIGKSKGTKHMIEIACQAGVRCHWYNGKVWKSLDSQLSIDLMKTGSN